MKKILAILSSAIMLLAITSCDEVFEAAKNANDTIYQAVETQGTNAKLAQPQQTEAATSITSPEPTQGEITLDMAKTVALSHAGFELTDVKMLESDFDIDDGIRSYEIEFIAANDKYEYDISASDGAIIKAEKNDIDILNTAPSSSQITAEDAKTIALSHAGVSASDAKFLKAELDSDDLVPNYEIEFSFGGYEYDYEINAASGEIIKSEKEIDD